MMSYLWILLLGSLLATSAQAEAGTAPEAEAAADAAAEAATTIEAPAADPEVIDPKAEEPAALGDEEAASSAGATPAQEESGPEATPAADPAVADNEEKAIVPTADAKPAVEEKAEPEVKVLVPARFDLEDALSEDNAAEGPGERRSFESGPQAAGASGDDKPEVQEAGSGSLAAILSAIAVSVVGAVVGYFTYQKKKLCFKNRGEADPEAARKAVATEAQADPQVLSNLLNSS
ncbi:hypothetical protein VZT92_005102 [Zoarces viviparus]|uniref:Uncharacterized protein n=1 Tax=Zoarces viviparus TaxID=48416 RepID=A0AAW1FS29_ZOAVI